MNRSNLRLVCLLAPACAALAASTVQISIHTGRAPRPLLDASQAVMRALATPIDYEDPPVAFSGDLADITKEVASPNPVAARLTPILGVRRTALDVEFAASRAVPDTALQSIVDTYNKSGSPTATFSFRRVGAHLQIIPDRFRDNAGNLVPAPVLLDTQIAAPGGTQSLLAALKSFCAQLSNASGVRIELGTIPTNYAIQNDVSLSAETKQARQILVQMLDSSYWHIKAVPGPRRQLIWHLLFEPNQNFYVLNLAIPEVDMPSPNGGLVTRQMTRP